jgi:hypothetical protein
MHNIHPSSFNPDTLAQKKPVRSAAEREASKARLLALALDLANRWKMRQGLEMDSPREDYPQGYEPGSSLEEPDRSAVTKFVDGATV